MTFQDYLSHSWKIHAKETETVYHSLATASEKLMSNEDIIPLARLITHICGDHYLEHWKTGVDLLNQLKTHQFYKAGTESETSVNRSIAILKLSAGQVTEFTSFSTSDQSRIFAQVAGILVEHKNIELGQSYFQKSIQLATKLDQTNKSEPAFRAIAMTTNNVTCTLEEKENRTESEKNFMIETAVANLNFWGLASDYHDVNMAEYRLSNTYLQAGLYILALDFAKKCYFGVLENKLSAYFEFYGLEMMILCNSKLENANEVKKYQQLIHIVYDKLSDDEKKSTEKTWRKIMALS